MKHSSEWDNWLYNIENLLCQQNCKIYHCSKPAKLVYVMSLEIQIKHVVFEALKCKILNF